MRAFALFFACYFAVLSCWFCTDVEPCAATSPTTTVQAAPLGGDSSHDVADWCSPLCQCHCSAGFALAAAPSVTFAGEAATVCYLPRYTRESVGRVPVRSPLVPWQPPRA